MIIANIIGGLGNQMFQYACARAITKELKMPLKVTQDMFGVYSSHYGPELERVFSLSLDVAQPVELQKMIGMLRVSPLIRRVLASRFLTLLRGRYFIVEPHFRYWDELYDRAQAGGYLQGYWQSERYFARHTNIIRKDFEFKNKFNEQNKELVREIRKTNSISVHVRHGDYVKNAKTYSVHGICTPEYYFEAIEFLEQQVSNIRLFAFSDDHKWVAEVLKSRYPELVLVDHNRGGESYNDMRLMSFCRHHIIANSSFSWWGAWLNPAPNKIVIAPRKWFTNGRDSTDLVPDTWIRL